MVDMYNNVMQLSASHQQYAATVISKLLFITGCSDNFLVWISIDLYDNLLALVVCQLAMENQPFKLSSFAPPLVPTSQLIL